MKDPFNITAYVDETGTNELDSSKPGVSNLFICVAVVVNDDEKLITELAIEKLSNNLNSGAEIASKKIGSKHKRRLKFLNVIKDLPFSYYALLINKDHIFRDSGLSYKRTFYKYINRKLYEKMANEYRSLHIIADEIGGRDFMDSFKYYLEEKRLPNLFSDFKHSFESSEKCRMIQLADLIVGTLSFCFDEDKKCEYSQDFRDILRKKELHFVPWPPYLDTDSLRRETNQEFDNVLSKALQKKSSDFLKKNLESEDDDIRMQAITLQALFFARIFEEIKFQSVTSEKLINILKQEGFTIKSKQDFMSKVTGKLRDAGIILTGTNNGLRLALSANDIDDYISFDQKIIEPMLRRLIIARNIIKTETMNKYDIFNSDRHEILRSLADKFNDKSMEHQSKRVNEDEAKKIL